MGFCDESIFYECFSGIVNKPTFVVGCVIIFVITIFKLFMNLSTLATIRAGYTFKHGIRPSSHPTHSVVQLRDVDKESDFLPINWDSLCRTELSPRYRDSTLIDGDVIIVAKGQVKKAFCLKHVPFPTVVNQHFFVLKVKDSNVLQAEFLTNYLNSRTAQDWLNNNSNGNYQSIVSKKILSGVPLPDIPIHQQKMITASITKAKYEIDLHKRFIRDYEQKVESLF